MGDSNFITNNKVLLRNHRNLPAIVCVQNKADKKIITEEGLQKSNMNGFSFAKGEDVGTITNRITTQMEIQSNFEKDSAEWLELEKRIICGQLYQQNSIDKLKGVQCNPMPREWYNDKFGDIGKFNKKIVCWRKPKFMMYIYPEDRAKYNNYLKEYEKKSKLNFQMSMCELLSLEAKTEPQELFIHWYYEKMPVGLGNCVMNRICEIIEREFKDVLFEINDADFDYSILKSKTFYSLAQFKRVENVYKEYLKEIANFRKRRITEKIEKEEIAENKKLFLDHFKSEVNKICRDREQLCNIVIDLCYSKEVSKGFAWDICKKEILDNIRGNTTCL